MTRVLPAARASVGFGLHRRRSIAGFNAESAFVFGAGIFGVPTTSLGWKV